MQALRELSAIGLLVLRSWQRMGPRVRAGRAPEPTRGVSAVLMRLVVAALIYNFGTLPARQIAARPHPEWSATWAAFGLGCYAFGIAFSIEIPYARAPTSALKSALLELLPVSLTAQLALTLAQAIWGVLPILGFVLTLRAELGAHVPFALAGLLALELYLLCTLSGICLAKLLKLRLSPYWASRASWLASLVLVAGIALVQLSLVALELRPPLADQLGGALLGHAQPLFIAGMGVLAALAVAGFYRLERAHELAEPVRAEKTASALGAHADMATTERLLIRREPGGRAHWFAAGVHLVYVGGATYFLKAWLVRSQLVLNFAALMCFQLVTSIGAQRAARGAMRDVLARPLLGALPIAPTTTLHAKARALRGTLLIIAAPIVLLLGAGYVVPALLPTLLWRVAALLAAVVVYAPASVYVAFLTVGLGSTRPRAGAFGSLESMLLAIPFATVAFAPDPWVALLALLTLLALTFEARRSALRVVDFLDDPEQGHATEVWRALVVFAGFQGAQLLAMQVASLFGDSLSSTLRFVVVYALAAAALWFPTQREQSSPRPEQRIRYAPLGVLGGLLSGGCAWAYLHFFHPSGAGAPELAVTNRLEGALLAVVVVCVAPLVEERFFRGWLQRELERSLPKQRYLAPLLTALAFALAHPAYSFLPVLIFGLISGLIMLRTRSLAACVVAHALHNAIALSLR